MTRSTFISAALILPAALLTAPMTANAQTPQMQTPDMMSKLYACKTIADSAARLACYDRNIGVVETAQETGELITIDKAGARKIQKESFGFNIPSLPQLGLFTRSNKDKSAGKSDEDDFETVTANIKVAERLSNGRYVFTLDNGQVWAQTESSRVPLISKKRTNTLRIKRAVLGSYMGMINDSRAGIRLRRVE